MYTCDLANRGGCKYCIASYSRLHTWTCLLRQMGQAMIPNKYARGWLWLDSMFLSSSFFLTEVKKRRLACGLYGKVNATWMTDCNHQLVSSRYLIHFNYWMYSVCYIQSGTNYTLNRMWITHSQRSLSHKIIFIAVTYTGDLALSTSCAISCAGTDSGLSGDRLMDKCGKPTHQSNSGEASGSTG